MLDWDGVDLLMMDMGELEGEDGEEKEQVESFTRSRKC